MNLRRVLAVSFAVFLVVIAAAASGLFLYSQYLYRDSYGSEYHYDVRLSPSAPVTNVTVLVPLPSHDGEPLVDADTVSHPFTPDDWAYDIVETEYGSMLRIRANEIPTEPTYHYNVIEDNRLVRWESISATEYDSNNSSHLRVTHDDVDISTGVESDRTIDTRSPIESESLLHPHENRTETACFSSQDEDETCYTYDGRIFVSYEAAPDTAVSISIELWGSNSWWVFGWNYNEYIDRQSVEIVGPQDGWVITDGNLETGQGNYRPPPK
ncbi:hypothetical protein [Haladaptatus sp. NG-SE-30]